MNKNISLKESIAVLIVLLALLGVLIIGFQLSPHIPILAAFMCLLFYGRFKKFTWDEIHDGIIKGINPDFSFDWCLSCFMDFIWNHPYDYGLWI